MYNVIICDDDANYAKYLVKMIMKSGLRENEVVFSEYYSGEELIDSLNTYENIDLLVLDMQMKEMDGHKTAVLFRKRYPSSIIVFCSGVCFPTVETFEVTPFRYLLKEYTDDRMKKELSVIVQEVKSRQQEPVIIATCNNRKVKLELTEILYIAIAKRGSNIYINHDESQYVDNEYLMSRYKVSELYPKLKYYGFEYAHNSYIINLKYVVSISREELKFSNGTVLSVARSKEKELRRAFVRIKATKY